MKLGLIMANKTKPGEKHCPRCAESIKAEATVCRHCGQEFTPDEIASAVKASKQGLGIKAGGCLVLVVVFLVLYSCMMKVTGPTSPLVTGQLQEMKDKVAQDAIEQYNMAVESGTKIDRCVHAGLVSAAFSQAQNKDNYAKWKQTEEADCAAAHARYEPVDRQVTAVEPSASMRAQRSANLPKAIDAVAEKLPFDEGHFDASMATFTVHQWSDLQKGLSEMRRVTKGPVVILSCEPSELDRFWLAKYCFEVIAAEAGRYPSMETLAASLGGNVEVRAVPIPLNCRDGFNEAYYGRPERLLDPHARLACSAWTFVDATATARFEQALSKDLKSGAWDERNGYLRSQPTFEGSLKLLIASP